MDQDWNEESIDRSTNIPVKNRSNRFTVFSLTGGSPRFVNKFTKTRVPHEPAEKFEKKKNPSKPRIYLMKMKKRNKLKS